MIGGNRGRLCSTIPPRRPYQPWVPYTHIPHLLFMLCSVTLPLLMCTFVLFSLGLLPDSSCCFVDRQHSCCTILRLPTSPLPMYSVTLFSLVLLTDSSCCFVLLVYCWLCLLFPPSTQRRVAQSFGGELTSELDITFLFCGHLVFS